MSRILSGISYGALECGQVDGLWKVLQIVASLGWERKTMGDKAKSSGAVERGNRRWSIGCGPDMLRKRVSCLPRFYLGPCQAHCQSRDTAPVCWWICTQAGGLWCRRERIKSARSEDELRQRTVPTWIRSTGDARRDTGGADWIVWFRNKRTPNPAANPTLPNSPHPPSILAQAHSNAKEACFEFLGFVVIFFSSLLPLDW